ncbi:hypothetical protein [Ramlibacter alkalitolerans]|uniref:CMP/dCMP-type deaminase domain-containing protein n=1 Tax=Ramlibacter alkalitolerans TaxID=2039631 RepID=A0ABS1JU52_9BURK|nr:hypothetical protein [Ramlibacter alkalitolerans]MBL0427701.1 hypothetical protein [Ramlibacter alkalitolerans]
MSIANLIVYGTREPTPEQVAEVEARRQEWEAAHPEEPRQVEPATEPVMPLFVAVRLTGRCLEGERDGGRLEHIVASEAVGAWGKALCHARPGLRGNGWSPGWLTLENATCPRCVKAAKRLGLLA